MAKLKLRRLSITGAICLACFSLLALTAGCVEQTLSIDSAPTGALVYLNGEEFGRTPVKKDFVWYGKYDVAVRAEGYETLQTASWVKAPWWNWVPLDFIATVLPCHFHDHQHLFYTLTPTPMQAIDPDILIKRGEELRSQLESSPFTRAPTTRATTHPSTSPASRP